MDDLFSQRDKPLPDVFQYDFLPAKFRQQVVWEWKQVFTSHAYAEFRAVLCRRHGKPFLVSDGWSPDNDFLEFFQKEDSPVDICLDAIELSLKLAVGWTNERDDRYMRHDVLDHFERSERFRKPLEMVRNVNRRFLENGIGYEFDFKSARLMRIGSLHLHQEAVVPALRLLTDPAFKTANDEFLKAHKHFRDREYPDCLTACCASFESTIKIACDQKGWKYDPKDSASALVKTYMDNSGLDSYFETLLMIIATLRNRLGPHGKGTAPVVVPEHLAKYALHSTASAILLLVDHAKTVP